MIKDRILKDYELTEYADKVVRLFFDNRSDNFSYVSYRLCENFAIIYLNGFMSITDEFSIFHQNCLEIRNHIIEMQKVKDNLVIK